VLYDEIVVLLSEAVVLDHEDHAIDDIPDALPGCFEIELHGLLETEIGRASLQQRGIVLIVVIL
jgi:hypothetical protein